MVIEVNKDIDRYQESVAMGLTARQLIFSIASVVVGEMCIRDRAYDGIEIAMKVGSGGIAAMQKAIDFLKGMLDYEKSLGKTSMRLSLIHI